MEESGNVQYSVKELLAIQAKSLERIERKVDEGAVRQAEAIARIDTRVTVLEQLPNLEPRVRSLEESRSEGAGTRRWTESFWVRLGAAGAVFGGLWWLPHHHL